MPVGFEGRPQQVVGSGCRIRPEGSRPGGKPDFGRFSAGGKEEKPVKIAVFTDSYRPYVSGVVRSIDTFTEEFLSMGHAVYIFAPRYYTGSSQGQKGALQEEHWGDGLKVFRYWSVPVPTYAGFVLPVPISPSIDHVIRRLGVQIIHSHTPFLMGRLGAAVAKRHNLPLVFTHHTLYHEYVHYVPGIQGIARRLVLRHLARYCRRCQLIVAPTPMIQRFIADTYRIRTPIVSIPTGVDLSLFERADPTWLRRTYGIGDDQKVLVFVGRMGREKNVDLLLDAFEIVHDARPDTVLVMVGDGPERARLEERVRNRGLSPHVIFTGTLDKARVADVYAGSNLFFFASTTETQGLVTLEAMAAGLPVAAVDAQGTRDLVRHGRQGLLADATAPSLARQALAILGDADLMRRLAREARRRAAQFSSRQQSLRLLEAYEWVAGIGLAGRSKKDQVVALQQEYSSTP